MKRLNPDTDEPFKQGDVREDGCRFWGYSTKIAKKTGYFYEVWRTWHNYQKSLDNAKHYVKKFADKNPAKINAKTMKRHAAKKNRTPPWLTKEHFKQMEEMYARAKIAEDFTGVKYHVDHIEPLQGKDVCGLHVPWNLQLLTKKDNIKKGNRRVEQKSTAPVSNTDYFSSEIDSEFRTSATTGTRKDSYDLDHYCRTVRGEDADYRTKKGS